MASKSIRRPAAPSMTSNTSKLLQCEPEPTHLLRSTHNEHIAVSHGHDGWVPGHGTREILETLPFIHSDWKVLGSLHDSCWPSKIAQVNINICQPRCCNQAAVKYQLHKIPRTFKLMASTRRRRMKQEVPARSIQGVDRLNDVSGRVIDSHSHSTKLKVRIIQIDVLACMSTSNGVKFCLELQPFWVLGVSCQISHT